MRHPLKHKAMTQLAISGLLGALLCPALALAASDDPCTKTSKVQPYTKENLKTSSANYCKSGPDRGDCQNQLQEYANIATGFLADMKTACAANDAALKAAPATDSQGIEKAKGLLKSGEEGSRNLADTAAKRAREATRELTSGVSKLEKLPASAAPMDAATHNTDIANLRKKLNSPDDTMKESDVSGQMKPKVGALRFGSELRKVLVEAQRDFNATADNLSEMKKKLDGKNPNGSGDDTASKDKKGGGLMDSLNPNTLLGLATAGMGLASALKKNPDNSSVSTPSDTTPPATAVAATGLGGDGKAASQSPNMSAAATKTETPNSSSGGSPAFSASPFTPDSEVTNRSSRQAGLGSATPASSSGGAGLEGFGGGSSGSSRSPDSSKDPGTALAKAPEDPLAGSFGGGGGSGGGGLNFGSSSSSGSEPMHTEDPLKETLQDMAAAVDSGNGGNGTSADDVQGEAGGQDFGSSNEFLFTRVHSAIQRSLKRGGVVSGLSAKIR